ncbi:MAG: SGNH/GDSL hydrolase family protein [Ruminococcus sp.]|nr:SGNH/GDSL hydrolase family protein [Ruminococcus sp.]
MKKLITLSAAVITALSLFSCGSTNGSGSQPKEESSAVTAQDIGSPAPVKTDSSDFRTYVSNTYISTGNNYWVDSADSVTYRAYFPVEEYGELEYKFYFSNTVDSTYDDGKHGYVGQVGEGYTIENAFIADGGTSVEDEITGYSPVTFSGSTERQVSGGETFWSDPVSFDVPEGHFLVWEWTVTGQGLPATSMSNLTKTLADYGDGKGMVYCDQLPLPQLIGAKRDVKYRISAVGDSITQGCQTQFMEYEFWAARIAQRLGSQSSFYNCGLGWSRTSDIAAGGDWISRAAQSDVVIVAFGTNDIISGEYGGDGGNSADEILQYLRTVVTRLKDEGCSVIVFSAPPEDYRENMEAVRKEYNEKLPELCQELGVTLFDFASYLSAPEDPAHALYGGHPNGEGGQIVADAFVEEFGTFLGIE